MNMIKKASALGAVLLAATLTVGIAAPANAYPDNDPIIADGDFDGAWDASWYSSGTLFTTGSAIGQTGAWTVSEGSFWMGEGTGTPGHGPAFLAHDPADPTGAAFSSAISQTFATTPGASYDVLFFLSILDDAATFEVLIDGVPIDTFTGIQWLQPHTAAFVGTGDSAVVTFRTTTASAVVNPAIFDQVSLVQTACGDPTDGSVPPDCLPTPIDVVPTPILNIVIGAGAAAVAASIGTAFYLRRRKQAIGADFTAA